MAWHHSSSSSSTHHYVDSYNYEPLPYSDDDDDGGDVDSSMVEHRPLDDDDCPYDGPGVEDYDDGDVEPSMVGHWPLDDDDDYPYGAPGVEDDMKPTQTRPPGGVSGGAVAGRRVHDYDDDAATVWYYSYSSSSTTHHYVTTYIYEPLPYFDDDGEGDVKPPSMVDQWRLDDDDYLYGGSGVEEDVKPAKKKQPACPTKAKKRKAPAAAASAASRDGDAALRSELKAKERALAQAKGKICKLERELDKSKKRELAQALAFERQLGTHVLKKAEGGGKAGAGAGKRRRGA